MYTAIVHDTAAERVGTIALVCLYPARRGDSNCRGRETRSAVSESYTVTVRCTATVCCTAFVHAGIVRPRPVAYACSYLAHGGNLYRLCIAAQFAGSGQHTATVHSGIVAPVH